MNYFIRLITFLLMLSDAAASFAQTEEILPFEPDIMLQLPNVRDFTISTTGHEAYFSAQSPMGDYSVIMKLEKSGGEWTQPEILPFSGKFMDLEPFLTLDDKRLYFASNRPLSIGENKAKDYDIWYVERGNSQASWSAPINCGSPVNSDHNEFYPSLTQSGNLYFTSDPPTSKGKDDIYFCHWNGAAYEAPVSLGDSINTEGYEFNAFIAPDESYLIYSGYNRSNGLGSGDLYISFRNSEGLWSSSFNLGESVNSNKLDYCPFVHAQSNTLYFTSKRIDLTPPDQGFKSAADFVKFVNSYQNGLSRIYHVKFDPNLYR